MENLLLKNGKGIFLAYDHGLEHGPSDFSNKNSSNPEFILNLAYELGFQAVIFQKGVAEKYYNPEWKSKIPLILKLNGKTKWQDEEPYSPLVCSLDYAKKLGAVAVGYTLYPGSKNEGLMFKEFAKVQEEARKLDLIVIAWIYPRGSKIKEENSPEVVQYAARIGLELGADFIKIKYSGSEESFRKAVEVAKPVRVFLSGGPKRDDFLKTVEEVMRAGASGLAVGRNVWQSDDPYEIGRKIYQIVFKEEK